MAASAVITKSKASVSRVLLVGSPNVGKTALYNYLSGEKHREVNYPGSTVTVQEKNIVFEEGTSCTVCDTPGVSTVHAQSQDERLTWGLISGADSTRDTLLFVADPLQLGKQLVLLRHIQRTFHGNIALILNYGCCGSGHAKLQLDKLSSLIKIPVLEVYAREKGGYQGFKEKLLKVLHKKQSNTYSSGGAFQSVQQFGATPILTEKEIHEDFMWAERLVKRVTVVSSSEDEAKLNPLDKLFLHPIGGVLSFLVTMTLFFWSLFGVASPVMEVLESGVGLVQAYLHSLLPDSFFTAIVVDGVLTGVGAALIFAPQIFVLFLGLGIMEQSGFLARGALVVDKPLSKIGLSGRSFLPLLTGFACAIPAFLAARNIPREKERKLAQLITPLISCSARLPVYGLLISLLLYNRSGVVKAATMTLVYLVSILLVCLLSTLLSKLQSDKVSQEPVFHIALPRWRKPQFGAVIQRAYVQARDFLLKAGPHILWISLLLWFISNYPNQTDSYAIKLGKWLEPIFYPMGIDWKVGVALLFAFAAREVFVPALALIFSQQVTQEGLLTMLGNATFENSEKLIFTPATVIGLIVFFMVSLQCLSTVAVAKKEMGSFKYPAFLMIGYTLAGYILSVGVVQGLRLLGIP